MSAGGGGEKKPQPLSGSEMLLKSKDSPVFLTPGSARMGQQPRGWYSLSMEKRGGLEGVGGQGLVVIERAARSRVRVATSAPRITLNQLESSGDLCSIEGSGKREEREEEGREGGKEGT